MNLLCGKGSEFKISMLGMALMFGYMLGSLLLTNLSDIYGRKSVLLVVTTISSLMVPLICLMQSDYYPTMVLCLLFGMTTPCRYSVAFMYTTELTTKAKAYINTVFCVLFDSLVLVLLGIYYLFFKKMDVSLYLMMAIQIFACVAMMKFMPESPHYLLSKDDKHQFCNSIIQIAQFNNIQISYDKITQDYDEFQESMKAFSITE